MCWLSLADAVDKQAFDLLNKRAPVTVRRYPDKSGKNKTWVEVRCVLRIRESRALNTD